MELKIQISDEEELNTIILLKNFIEESLIEGIEKIEIDSAPLSENQMGVGEIFNSITTVIHAASKPLTELVKCLKAFVETFKTEATIKLSNGSEIIIKQRGSLSEDAILRLIKMANDK